MIVLPEVNALELRPARDLSMIVDDKWNVVFRCDEMQFGCERS